MEIDIGRVLDALPAMVWTVLLDGHTDFVNRRWSEYTGLSLEQADGWAWQDAVEPDDLPRLLERWRSILASGEPSGMETRLRRFDGEYRWFLVQCSPMFDDAGRITKWCGVGRDVEDFRRAEETLRLRELEFRSIIDSIPVPVVVTTPSAEFEGLNQSTLDCFGKSFEELKDWKSSDVVHPDDVERMIAVQLEAYQNGNAYNVESRHRRADGVYHWYNVLGLPLRDPQGKNLRWLHLLIDIDDRKRAEDALRSRERESRLILDNIPAFVSLVTSTGGVELYNRQVLDYTGKTPEELKNWKTSDVGHPDDLPRAIEIFTKGIRTGDPFDIELRMRRFDGAYRWFQSHHHPQRGPDGCIVRWYVAVTDIDDRKRAEEALRISESNLKLLIDTLPDLVWSTRPDGSVEFVNQHFLNYVGLSFEEVCNLGWTAAFHPDDLSRLSLEWGNVLATGKAATSEGRLRRFDGEYRWFLLRANPLHDEKGNVVRWYGVNTDIDDRKRAEALLAGEKHLLEMIALGNSARDVLNALCKMVEGAAPDCYCTVQPIDWSGPTFEYSVAPSLPASYSAPVAGLAVNGDILPCGIAAHQRIQVVTADIESDPRWQASFVRTHVLEHGLISVWSTPIYSKEGGVLGTFCIVQRKPGTPSPYHQTLISHATQIASIAIERSRTEAALRRSETLLAEGQRLSSTGAFSWRVDTDEIAFSEELYRIFEFEKDSVVTLERARARVHPEDIPLLSAQMARVRAGHGYPGYEIRLRMPDGRVKHVRTYGRVMRHHDGRLECLTAVQDITERRLADEALSKARSDLAHVAKVTSLGALTASIAHEVNQPLSGIITNASTCLRMLASDPPNIDVAQETARRTIRDGNRAADVITRLRGLFSKRPPAIEPMDLNEAAQEVIALLRSDLQRNGVVLRTELAERLPLVGGDRVQLQQVIMNLLRNAADAMSGVDDQPRRLLVRTEPCEDGHVRLSVRDAGPGFEADSAERLFEVFYTTKSDGMGIGLSVSRSIIESHSGRLWAQANDGPGVTFFFSIPEYSGDEPPMHDISVARAPVTGNAQSSEGAS